MTSARLSLRPTSPAAQTSARTILFLLRARAWFVLIALVILFSSLAPSFLTANNLAILTKHVAISAILAIGMTFVVLTGGIDLSVGSVAGLSGMVAGYMLTQGIFFNGVSHFPPVPLLILITLLVCLVIGILNGWLVAKAGVAPFIATLGTLYIARGAALLLSNGKTFPNLSGQVARANTGFTQLGQRAFLGLPLPVWIMLALFVVAMAIASK